MSNLFAGNEDGRKKENGIYALAENGIFAHSIILILGEIKKLLFDEQIFMRITFQPKEERKNDYLYNLSPHTVSCSRCIHTALYTLYTQHGKIM